MSNDELKKYKEMYGKLVEQLVHLHNRNLFFIEHADSARPPMEIRAIIKQIQIITRDLKTQTKLVHEEGLQNLKEQKRLNRELKKKQVGRWYPRKKKENNNDNNSSTSSTI